MGLIREWYRGEACAAPTALSIFFCFEYPGLTAWATLCRTYGAWRSDNAKTPEGTLEPRCVKWPAVEAYTCLPPTGRTSFTSFSASKNTASCFLRNFTAPWPFVARG